MGCECEEGARGPRGYTGEQGIQGEQGLQGLPGTPGLTGLDGIQGLQGDQGDKGDQGDQGIQGIDGAIGLAGADGADGNDGVDGADGAQGPEGPQGDDAYNVWLGAGNVGTVQDFIDDITGPQGPQGPIGVGVTSVAWTSNSAGQPEGTAGTTDTYTITLDDASTSTFPVTHGSNGSSSLGEGFYAEGEPANINSVSAAIGVTDLCDPAAVLQIIPEIYDDSSTYDHTTGIWEVAITGRYDLSFFVSLTNLTGWSNGRVKAGILDSAGCVFRCVNFVELDGKMEKAQVAGSAIGVPLTAGDRLVMKIVNVSTTNYVMVSGDVVRMSARKVG